MSDSTSIDDAIQAAEAVHADTTKEDLKAAHRDVVVLVGEVGTWLKTFLTEADEAEAKGDLDKFEHLEAVLAEVKMVFDEHADDSSRTSRRASKKRRRDGNRPGWLRETFVEPFKSNS